MHVLVASMSKDGVDTIEVMNFFFAIIEFATYLLQHNSRIPLDMGLAEHVRVKGSVSKQQLCSWRQLPCTTGF